MSSGHRSERNYERIEHYREDGIHHLGSLKNTALTDANSEGRRRYYHVISEVELLN